MNKHEDIYSIWIEASKINNLREFNGEKLGNGSHIVCVILDNMNEDWMIQEAKNSGFYFFDEGARTPVIIFLMGVSKKFAKEYIEYVNLEFPDLKLTILKGDEVF